MRCEQLKVQVEVNGGETTSPVCKHAIIWNHTASGKGFDENQQWHSYCSLCRNGLSGLEQGGCENMSDKSSVVHKNKK